MGSEKDTEKLTIKTEDAPKTFSQNPKIFQEDKINTEDFI